MVLVGSFRLSPALSASQHELLRSLATRKRVNAGATLVRRGAVADQLYIVVSGRLKAAIVSGTGRDRTFNMIAPGEIFGEVGMFGGGKRSADVTAIEDCEVCVLQRSDVQTAFRKDPTIAFAILKVMADRIRGLSDQVEDATSIDAGARFAKSLVRLAQRFGVQALPRNLQVRLKLSQQDLADLVGISRVFANNKLKAWEKDGILTHRSRLLTIHDLRALRLAAGLSDDDLAAASEDD
jgi:CRP/FNR family cyclic AMP-dependent transcriptional regulator